MKINFTHKITDAESLKDSENSDFFQIDPAIVAYTEMEKISFDFSFSL